MKNLSRIASQNANSLDSKTKEQTPVVENRGLLNKPKSDKIEDTNHISLQLRKMVKEALS